MMALSSTTMPMTAASMGSSRNSFTTAATMRMSTRGCVSCERKRRKAEGPVLTVSRFSPSRSNLSCASAAVSPDDTSLFRSATTVWASVACHGLIPVLSRRRSRLSTRVAEAPRHQSFVRRSAVLGMKRRPVGLLAALLVVMGVAVLDRFQAEVTAFLHLGQLVDAAWAQAGPTRVTRDPMSLHCGHETY